MNRILGKYDTILPGGVVNSDKLKPDSDLSNHLPDAKNAFNLKIVSREPTYIKSQYGNLIGTMLRNRPRRFSNSRNFEIGVSDCHK